MSYFSHREFEESVIEDVEFLEKISPVFVICILIGPKSTFGTLEIVEAQWLIIFQNCSAESEPGYRLPILIIAITPSP